MRYTPIRLALAGSLLLGTLAGPARAGDTDSGKKYALLVGVSEFEKSRLRNLPGARNDVEKLRDALVAGGFETAHVTLMTNYEPGANKPTAANVRAALRSLLARSQPDDTVVVAFAGHGFQLKDVGGHYFAASDTVLDQPDSMVALHDVFRDLTGAKAGRKLLMVDACRVDPFTDSADGKKMSEKIASKLKLELPAGGNLVALFSCSESQASLEDRELNHGVFFHYVIQGLRGHAADPSGTVTAVSLAAYVRPKVEKHVTEKFKEKQDPMLRTGGEVGSIPLVRPGDSPKVQRLLAEAEKLHADGEALVEAAEKVGEGQKPDEAAIKQAKEEARKYTELAVEKLTAAITDNPRAAEAYVRRGLMLRELGRYEPALDDFDQSLALDPTNAAAIGERGWTSLKAGDKNEAARQLKRALKMRPADADLARNLGYVYMIQENYDAALAVYSGLIDANPGLAKAFHDRATALYNLKKYDDAIKDYDQAVELDPHSTRYRADRMEVAAMLEKADVVERDAKRFEQVASYAGDAGNFQGQVATLQNYNVIADRSYARGDTQTGDRFTTGASTLVGRMQEKQMDAFERKLSNNPLLRQSVERSYGRMQDLMESGRPGMAQAEFNKFKSQLPPAMRAAAEREWKEFKQENQGRPGGLFQPRNQPQNDRPGGLFQPTNPPGGIFQPKNPPGGNPGMGGNRPTRGGKG